MPLTDALMTIRPSPVREHDRQLMTKAQEDRAHIGVEYLVIDGVALLLDRRAPLLETGIVEGDVEPAVALDRGPDQALDIVLPRDVGPDRQRLRAESPASAAAASISASRRPAITTAAAPSSAILSAAARPMPLPPPVTRQTFPFIRLAAAFEGLPTARP